METYVFKLLGDDETVLDVRSVALLDLRAVWAAIADLAHQDLAHPDLAHQKNMTGGRIIVSNCLGEVLILVGVATARSYPASSKKPEARANLEADGALGISRPGPQGTPGTPVLSARSAPA
jgi:hypothetical protein